MRMIALITLTVLFDDDTPLEAFRYAHSHLSILLGTGVKISISAWAVSHQPLFRREKSTATFGFDLTVSSHLSTSHGE